MKLGEKILKLRKGKSMSQEQLAEKVEVTRQTISNWELGETSPNTEQLLLLSKVLNISVDELLDNDIKSILEEKVSNTEKLAGLIIKILKVFGIFTILYFIIMVISFVVFTFNRTSVKTETIQNMEMICHISEEDYMISVGSDGYFNCSNCNSEIQKALKNNYIDFGILSKTEENIKTYFKNNNGYCE